MKTKDNYSMVDQRLIPRITIRAIKVSHKIYSQASLKRNITKMRNEKV